ncbi:putative formin-like protein 6 [Apostichopus japonicus]|uniref:Putative formin-like protein 6 n=1 Tax=Stichopus japonicus TaxID=307972 RepID=A0A2G8K969_STIJA|nr:putative formin-like protein 6 [Apostichopus japonicus]
MNLCRGVEGLKFFIYFRDHHEYELEADTLEEKEKICRLLQLIIENNKSRAGNHVARSKDIHSHVTKCQKVIQEGFLEKKNHSLYTTWTRRWVRIRKGELSYYKPDDENQQALNIVQLSKEINIIKKLGSNGFSIATRKKVYQFRIISSGSKGKDIELQRDEWFKAVQYACGYHRESISGFNDDVFAKETTISPSEVIDQSYQHNINLTLRSFYTEIDKLQSMMGINELKDDANRSLVVLKQIVQGLEGFITHPPQGNSRMSCGSLSSNNESVSDQSRLSLGQRWSTDTTDSGRHHGGGDRGSPTRIVSDSLFQRSSFIEGALEPVMEMNNENGLTPVDEMDNGMLRGDGKRSSETPGEPPPLPLTGVCGGPAVASPPPPPPPPPPPLMAPQVKRVFKVTSKIKMKPFHWTRVPNNHYSKSLWKNARDLTEVIDTDQLEMLYSDTKLKDGPDPDTSKTKLKSILDPKVAQNLGIFLAGFKMEVEEVKHRLTILRESEGGLSPEHIADLRKYHPNAEDMEAYKQFKDKPQELAPTDQFMMHFCEIPLLKTRLDLLFFASELPIKFEDLVPTIDNTLAGCRALIFSQKFTAILEYILAIGNFINSGSSKGTAPGFRLLSLPKLVDCKGKDKKFTLMKYLVQQIHQIDSELLDFTDELLPITFVPEASVKALQAEVEVMKKDLMLVRRNANVLLSGENPPERDVLFCDDVESFAEQLDLKLGEMQCKTDEMKKLYDDILVSDDGINRRSVTASQRERNQERYFWQSVTSSKLSRERQISSWSQPEVFKEGNLNTWHRDKPSCKSSARDSAVESYTSLDQSDSAGSDLEQLDENMEHSSNGHLSSFRKSFDKKRFGGSKRRREIKNTSKRQATYKRLPDNPTKEGYLDKLSNQKTPLSSQWNRRYFELTAQGYLYYSKRKNEKNVESIYLRGCPIALEDDRVILIQTEERSYKLRATSTDAKEWWNACWSTR